MDNIEYWLSHFVNNTVVWPDGTVIEIKTLVNKVRNLRIEMYSNDHNPPHFHVKTKCGTINAKFKLEDCSLLSGEVDTKDYRRIKAFHKDFQDELWKYWNEKVIQQ
jgi:intein/homing endonuclease